MLKHLNKIKNNYEEGFTLVELLVVILIIGILSSVTVPMYLNNRKAAAESSLQSDLKNAGTSTEGSYNDPIAVEQAATAYQSAINEHISLISNNEI